MRLKIFFKDIQPKINKELWKFISDECVMFGNVLEGGEW
jgi:hypothetical protein